MGRHGAIPFTGALMESDSVRALLATGDPAVTLPMAARVAAHDRIPVGEVLVLCRPLAVSKTDTPLCMDEGVLKRYPTLVEYLGQDTWEDGTAREVSTVLAVMECGLFKGCLIDKEGERTLWVTAPTPEKLWMALESALSGPRPDWRKRKEAYGKRK